MFYAQILVNGVLPGGLYGLMALGMALVWGVLNIVNLAHGSFIMLGGYAVYYLVTLAGIDPFLALPFGMPIMFVFGFLVQRYIINFIVGSAHSAHHLRPRCRHYLSRSAGFQRRSAREWLAFTGLDHRIDQRAEALGGPNRKRLELAKASPCGPSCFCSTR